MSGLFRSESMTCVQLLFSEETANPLLRALAGFNRLHIVDQGAPEQPFYKRAKARQMECIQWAKRFENFRQIMKQFSVPTPDPEQEADESPSTADVIEELKASLNPLEEELALHVNFREQYTTGVNQLIEHAHVLQWCQSEQDIYRRDFSAGGGGGGKKKSDTRYGSFDAEEDDEGQPILESKSARAMSLCGVILADKQSHLERMIFRVSRGVNAITRFNHLAVKIADPASGELTHKAVFSVMFVGDQLKRRVEKICGLMGATVYEVPDTSKGINKKLAELAQSVREQYVILRNTETHIKRILSSISGDEIRSPLVTWEARVKEERIICDAMRKCFVPTDRQQHHGEESGSSHRKQQQQHAVVVMKGWLPSKHVQAFKQCVKISTPDGQQVVVEEMDTHDSPPTLFPMTKFTSPFQGIVDTYGIPRYKEANPGIFTIVTFPFLFGVMYGDIFHGTCLTIFAIYLLWNEEKYLRQQRRGEIGEMFGMTFGGRYLLILMGLFALYCGTLYNDCASIPLNVWGTRWDYNHKHKVLQTGVYPWGIDPSWAHKANELMFVNSLKMKLSIILGVTQMSFGIILGLFNDIYFDDPLAAMFEFIPRLLVMQCTFGYMCFLIIFKWCIDWESSAMAPPSILTTMISMFLAPGKVDPTMQFFPGQGPLQAAMLLTVLVCIFLMLFAIPFFKHRQWKSKYGHLQKKNHKKSDGDEMERKGLLSPENDDDEHKDMEQEVSNRKHTQTDKHTQTTSPSSSSSSSSKPSKTKKSSSPPPPPTNKKLSSPPPTNKKSSSPPANNTHSTAATTTTTTTTTTATNNNSNSSAKYGGEKVDKVEKNQHTNEHKDDKGNRQQFYQQQDDLEDLQLKGNPEAPSHSHEVGPEYDVKDDMINIAIHTIEFVLGTVSNTASYLRLWALSLAHAELSKVFWEKIFTQYGFQQGGFAAMIGFAGWMVATAAVLLCMDVLECFLHALRLHWVEFQNKFFHADGYAFSPFSFKNPDYTDNSY